MKAVVVFLDDNQDPERIVEFAHDVYADERCCQVITVTDEQKVYELLEFFQEPEEPLEEQIDRLARFIMNEIPGEPSQDGGAVDAAIRLLAAAYLTADEKGGGECQDQITQSP